MKIECRCKQCGRMFVKYSYEKIVRCEDCRKCNRGLLAIAERRRSSRPSDACAAGGVEGSCCAVSCANV